MSEHVKLSQIAERLSVDISTVRRVLPRVADELGIIPTKGKQNVIYLKREDADALISYYETHQSRTPRDAITEQSFQKFGYFYIIQLVPEALPDRVKIGYTDNLDARLAEHRTAAPTSKLINSWLCKRSWDYAAMDSITREGCALVLNEVYEGDLTGFVERADAFFRLMPTTENETRLSAYSPLQESDESDSA